jgi:hypothetical protein
MTVYETWEHRYGAELRQVVTVSGAPAGCKVVLADEAKAELAEMREFYTETIQEQASDYLKACNIYEKRIAALEEGLQEYGRHKSGCGYFDPEVLDCTCGLSALKEDT